VKLPFFADSTGGTRKRGRAVEAWDYLFTGKSKFA
jgi:hypothetical protein